MAACVADPSSPAVALSGGRLSFATELPAAATQPGPHMFRGDARATFYLPVSAVGRSAPLLILLHGARGGADAMIRRFRSEADRRGIILLAPESAGETWDAVAEIGRGHPPAFGRDPARIDAAISQAFKRASIDPARIAIAGFSDGAGYALSLGTRNSDRFSAIMAFSPGMIVPGETGPPTQVFISHGAADRILPIGLARDTLAPVLKGAGFDVTFVAFQGGHELPDDVLVQALDLWLGPGKGPPRTRG